MNAFCEVHGGARIVLILDEQLQLLGDSRYEFFQLVHLLRHFVVFPLPVPVCNQPLDSAPGKIRHAASSFLLAHAHQLTEFVLGNPEVN